MTSVDASLSEHLEQFSISDRRVLAHAIKESYSYGKCGCCYLPWNLVEGRTVMYRSHSGMFAVCTLCWDQLGSARERLTYYLAIAYQWLRGSGFTQDDLRRLTIRVYLDSGEVYDESSESLVS